MLEAPGPRACVELPSDHARAVLFGAEHCELQPEIAEFILRERPSRVVVETALTPEMAAATGAEMRAGEGSTTMGPHSFMLQMWNKVAAELAVSPDPRASPLWDQVKMQFNGEQLAYIAAFAVGATLVYGDRPKNITYQRLLSIPTVEDLDIAFADQSANNYIEIITGRPPPVLEYKVFTTVMMAEREAVMCSAVADAVQKTGAGGCVVAVVGDAHVAGMQRMWASGQWVGLLSDALSTPPPPSVAAAPQPATTSPPAGFQDVEEEEKPAPGSFFQDVQEEGGGSSSSAGRPSAAEKPNAGVKRALLECALRLYCRPEVLADMQVVLGPVPGDEMEAYSLTHELYGTPRMLMAVLPEELLTQVCCGLNTDLWALLAPLRALRPVNGGPGFDTEEIMKLRMLNYQLN